MTMWIREGTYHAWATFLRKWSEGAAGDPAGLPALSPADLAGDTWARLTNHLTEALSQRLTTWSGTLARELVAAPDEFAAARALNHARWGLPPIRALASAPGLPPEVRTRLLDLVDAQIRSVQEQIDQQVRQQRGPGVPASVVEARLRTVRDNPLTAVLGDAHPTGGGWSAGPATSPRRRVFPA
ncbi:hypothetical protein [Actinoplanes sp. NPDC049265]|uniref:hypothetical protein n=1 Tax=Actinoplanes sp. NPDC049265 TaxID=3363902 RepID=UPI00371DDFC2